MRSNQADVENNKVKVTGQKRPQGHIQGRYINSADVLDVDEFATSDRYCQIQPNHEYSNILLTPEKLEKRSASRGHAQPKRRHGPGGSGRSVPPIQTPRRTKGEVILHENELYSQERNQTPNNLSSTDHEGVSKRSRTTVEPGLIMNENDLYEPGGDNSPFANRCQPSGGTPARNSAGIFIVENNDYFTLQ